MTSLKALQEDFQNWVLLGNDSIIQQTTSNEKVSSDVRLGIYANAYWLRLAEVLDNDYPGVKALLGDEEFQTMARAYINAHNSPYYNVRWYGDLLAQYLSKTLPYAHKPFLAEMAAFEWAMTLTFDAKDDVSASMEDVLAITPEQWPEMTFQMHPALQRLDLAWNVPAIWNSVDAREDIVEPLKSSNTTPWLLWRNDLIIYFRSLETDEAWGLDAIINGASFGEICEGLCEWHEETNVALTAASMLKRWLADGLIKDIDLI